MKDELRRAYDVLRHLKKKVGSHAFNEEYGVVISEIRHALQMPPEPKKKTKRTAMRPKQIATMRVQEHTDEPQMDDPHMEHYDDDQQDEDEEIHEIEGQE